MSAVMPKWSKVNLHIFELGHFDIFKSGPIFLCQSICKSCKNCYLTTICKRSTICAIMPKIPILVTIKVKAETRKLLKILAAATEQTMQDACDDAVKAMYEKKVLGKEQK